jgi:hypothetical protein
MLVRHCRANLADVDGFSGIGGPSWWYITASCDSDCATYYNITFHQHETGLDDSGHTCHGWTTLHALRTHRMQSPQNFKATVHNDVSTWQYTIFKPTLYTSGMVHFWNVFVHKPWDSVFYEWVLRVDPGVFFLKPGTLAKCMSWITVRHVYPAKNSLPGSRTRLVVNTLHS